MFNRLWRSFEFRVIFFFVNLAERRQTDKDKAHFYEHTNHKVSRELNFDARKYSIQMTLSFGVDAVLISNDIECGFRMTIFVHAIIVVIHSKHVQRLRLALHSSSNF